MIATPAAVTAQGGGTVVIQGVTLSAIFNEGEHPDLQSDGLPSILKTEVGTEVVEQRKRQALE